MLDALVAKDPGRMSLTGESMAYSYTERKRIRKSFGSRESVLEVPYLLQMQKDAYTAFLQADASPRREMIPVVRRSAARNECPRSGIRVVGRHPAGSAP